MPRPSSPQLSKLSLWMSMLLVWNIALLCIAIFFLATITQQSLSAEELAQACLSQLSPQP